LSWERWLREMILAGGALASFGCGSPDAGGACNANPDPCCLLPSGTKCVLKRACEADGGTYDPGGEQLPDGAILPTHCDPPYSAPDATSDAALDRPGDGDADASDSD
jgi:hypothetical protein